MNRLHLSIIVLLTLLLSSCDKRSKPEVLLTRLQRWDSEISTRNYFQGDTIYQSILDSLKMIDSESLSRKDEALYCLLYTCLSDKTLADFTNDSIISISVKTFKRENDIRNLFRAKVYQGIVRFRMDASDTVAFTILKEAEQLASSTDDSDESLFRIKGLLYGTMGRILEDDGNSRSVSDYLSKGIDYYKRSGDINNYLIDCLELAWEEMSDGNYREVEKTLSSIDTTALPDYIHSAIYNTYSALYHEQKLYKKSIDYRKKQIVIDRKLGGDADISDYYALSTSYAYVHPDSAMLYASRMLEMTDTDDPDVSYYYKQFADVAASLDRYEVAFDSLRLAWYQLQNKVDDASVKKMEELEKKYNYSEFERQAEKERNHKNATIGIFSFAFLILAIIGLIIYYRVKFINQMNTQLKSQRDKLSAAYSVMIKNISMIPEMVSNTDALSSKYVSQANVSKDISILSNQFRSNYKKGLSELSTILKKSHHNADMDYSSLSDKETIILCLSQDGYSSKEIAKMMCITDGNVRATLKKTHEKIK